jgi:hypothetical protein
MQKKKKMEICFPNIVDTADVIMDFVPICAGAKVFTIAKIALDTVYFLSVCHINI